MPQSITGSTLVVRFDLADFSEVSLADLQAWLARAQAQAQQPAR